MAKSYIAPWFRPGQPDIYPSAGAHLTIRQWPSDEAAIKWMVEQRSDIMRGRTVLLIDVTEGQRTDRFVDDPLFHPGFRLAAVICFDLDGKASIDRG